MPCAICAISPPFANVSIAAGISVMVIVVTAPFSTVVDGALLGAVVTLPVLGADEVVELSTRMVAFMR